MHYLQSLLDNTNLPVLYAFVLGLMTAVSPCPLATNITAVGYIGRDIENRYRIFINGLLYTLGRAVSYTSLGVVLYFGASKFQIARFFQVYGEKFLGPLLIVIGLVMLDILKIRWSGSGRLTTKLAEHRLIGGRWGAFILGVIFALAFCPYSGVLYFGMLIPMTIASAKGLCLPVIFAAATGLPVIIIAWLLAFSVSGIGSFYNKMKTIEKWVRRSVAVLFIGVGVYYSFIYLL
jgi:cytochrome c-type biogenesis protein